MKKGFDFRSALTRALLSNQDAHSADIDKARWWSAFVREIEEIGGRVEIPTDLPMERDGEWEQEIKIDVPKDRLEAARRIIAKYKAPE